MSYKFLLLPLFFLLGCDPTDRIHGNDTYEKEQLVDRQYIGDFRKKNFVEVNLSTYKELIVVVVERDKERFYPDGFTEGQDIKEIYYVVRPDALVFFNVESTDCYFIIVRSLK